MFIFLSSGFYAMNYQYITSLSAFLGVFGHLCPANIGKPCMPPVCPPVCPPQFPWFVLLDPLGAVVALLSRVWVRGNMIMVLLSTYTTILLRIHHNSRSISTSIFDKKCRYSFAKIKLCFWFLLQKTLCTLTDTV